MVLGILCACGPLAADVYLPALPQIIDDFVANDATGGLTLTVCLEGLGAGQFVWGPASDRFGRQRP